MDFSTPNKSSVIEQTMYRDQLQCTS
uniref:Uncharacterized protein n=1 Tax=Arundo donax TaxID=35708 RepID=A0A0A9HN01_ARUDO